MQQIPVRRIFWDALELALEVNTHRLARDIAVALGESDIPLLKALKEEKVKVYLFDEPADQEADLAECRCKEHVPCSTGPFLRECGNPVVWSASPLEPRTKCLEHAHIVKSGRLLLPTLYKWYDEITDETYVSSLKDGAYVYSESGELVGRYTGGSVLRFRVED